MGIKLLLGAPGLPLVLLWNVSQGSVFLPLQEKKQEDVLAYCVPLSFDFCRLPRGFRSSGKRDNTLSSINGTGMSVTPGIFGANLPSTLEVLVKTAPSYLLALSRMRQPLSLAVHGKD